MLEPADIVRQTQALAKQHDTAARAALAPLPPAAQRLGISIPIGTAVLDLVTGEKGTVISGKRQNVIIPAA